MYARGLQGACREFARGLLGVCWGSVPWLLGGCWGACWGGFGGSMNLDPKNGPKEYNRLGDEVSNNSKPSPD